MRTVRATRYVLPLREGGSMPGLVEADDDGLYVVKFRGAGQGVKALIAEILAGTLATDLELPVPELTIVDVDPAIARAEPDPEIQELVQASGGTNAGLDFLPGALPFSPAAPCDVTPELAAAIVWFDALVTNVDRTARNTNLLTWHGRLWLIDHGAALYRQHAPDWPKEAALRGFPQIAEHVLLPFAASITAADERLRGKADDALGAAVAAVPAEWWPDEAAPDVHLAVLRERLQQSGFAAEAEEARVRA